MRWIEIEPTLPVPMEFQKLIDACVDESSVREAIDELLTRKRAGQELDRQPKIAVLSDFITTQLACLEKIDIHAREKPNFEKLNVLLERLLIKPALHGLNQRDYVNKINKELLNRLQRGGEVLISDTVANGKYRPRACLKRML